MPPNHAERVINKFQQHQVASHLTSAGRQDSDRQKVLCCFRDPHRSPAPVEHAVARGACSSCGIPQPHSPLPSPCSCQTLRCTRATYLFTLTKIVHYCRRWFKVGSNIVNEGTSDGGLIHSRCRRTRCGEERWRMSSPASVRVEARHVHLERASPLPRRSPRPALLLDSCAIR